MNTTTKESTSDLFVFTAEDPKEVQSTSIDAQWKILIVDDEKDVHSTTLLALRGVFIEGRSLFFMHAYSASEAKSIIADTSDIAVLLLDVVMESESAGLDLVKHVRKELNRNDVRIVLRTGQPGYAPEVDTIRDYDINDYKTKSELTRTRLFTSLTVAIRSYRQIHQSEATRRGLESIINASIDLSRIQSVKNFADGVVTQLCALFDVESEGLVCAGNQYSNKEPPFLVMAAAGRYAQFIGKSLDTITDKEVVYRLYETLNLKKSTIGKGTCLYFPVSESKGIAAYIDLSSKIDEIDRQLIEIFSTNIKSGFENTYLQQKIATLAYFDRISGLPNRNSFIDFIKKEATECSVVAQIDIDNFSDINSILDLSFGDDVLRAVAARLLDNFPPPTRLARLGSDTFGLLGSQDAVNPHTIEAVFSDPFLIGEHSLRLSATSGLVVCSNESLNGINALKNSSVAVKQAKQLARSKCIFFDPAQSIAAKERLLMLSNLRSAFSCDRLFVVFQPFISLKNNQIVGAETLLRWKTDSGKFIPPNRFIPLAEESGLMVPLGKWIIRSAFREQRKFQMMTSDPFRIAINVSHVQFREPDFVETLAKAILEFDIDPTNVEIELTESVAIDNLISIMETLKQVRTLGVSISIDDFGTGYSSLSIISKLPIHRLKIDQSFIRNIETDSSISKLIIQLAKELNLETIAEGIESEAQYKMIQDLGCTEGQGYLFSRPLTADAFEDYFANQIYEISAQ